ncbi:large ribosomal subunit protein mL62-like [Styela clava]
MLPCIRNLLLYRSYWTTTRAGTFKSIYHLENLYPNSPYNYGGLPQDFSIASPPDKFTGNIPIDKLSVKYSRSSGPGGQNVNKVNSKAEVRFHVSSADWIPDDLKPKILEKYKKRITSTGELIVFSDESRYQSVNVKNCLDQIKGVLFELQKPPDPKKILEHEKLHDMNKIHEAHRKRLQRKRMKGYTKSMRRDFD